MESGPAHTVVAAPPHLLAEAAAAAAQPTTAEADGEPAENEQADGEVTKPKPDAKKPTAPFTVSVNGESAGTGQGRGVEYVLTSWERRCR